MSHIEEKVLADITAGRYDRMGAIIGCTLMSAAVGTAVIATGGVFAITAAITLTQFGYIAIEVKW